VAGEASSSSPPQAAGTTAKSAATPPASKRRRGWVLFMFPLVVVGWSDDGNLFACRSILLGAYVRYAARCSGNELNTTAGYRQRSNRGHRPRDRRTTAVTGSDMPKPQSTWTVDTRSGPVRALVHDGVAHLLGIPYAAPITRETRFLSASPPAPWQEPFDATSVGPIAEQHGVDRSI